MIYEIKHEVFANYHPGFDRGKRPIDTITIHGSAGGNDAAALFRWWNNMQKETSEWSKNKVQKLNKGIGFYNYLIDINGKIYQMLPENKWSFHSHAGFADRATIAICLVNTKQKNAGKYFDVQYHSLHELITDLLNRIPTIRIIDGHSTRAMQFSHIEPDTPCPGPLFEWQRLEIHNTKIEA